MQDSVLAIDPGKNGGGAHYDAKTKKITLFEMPYNDSEKAEYLNRFQYDVVIMETVQGYIGQAQPGARMFVFGESFGFLKGFFWAHNKKIHYVIPHRWQKTLGIGSTGDLTKSEWKNLLKDHASKLYPQFTKKQLNLKTADALLILHYFLNLPKS